MKACAGASSLQGSVSSRSPSTRGCRQATLRNAKSPPRLYAAPSIEKCAEASKSQHCARQVSSPKISARVGEHADCTTKLRPSQIRTSLPSRIQHCGRFTEPPPFSGRTASLSTVMSIETNADGITTPPPSQRMASAKFVGQTGPVLKENVASPRLTTWVSSPPKVLQTKCESTVQPSSPRMAQCSQVSGPSPLQGPSFTAITKLEKVACLTDRFLPELLKHLVSMEALLLARSGSGCDTQTHRNLLISLMKVKEEVLWRKRYQSKHSGGTHTRDVHNLLCGCRALRGTSPPKCTSGSDKVCMSISPCLEGVLQ